MDGWKKFVGTQITIFYDDGVGVSKKIGILKAIEDGFLLLKTPENDILIPIKRIVRVEMDKYE